MKTLLILSFLFTYSALFAQDSTYKQQELIYGRKDGMALTLMHIQPNVKSNKKAIIKLVSGNWFSGTSRLAFFTESAKPFLKRGYTVFMVMHGSQPRYAIPDMVADVQRATRFIRFNAKKFSIDPGQIGLTGSSSGGNLSLLVATAAEKKDTVSQDPVNKVSSRVQAVAVFYPPTDFLNWGEAGRAIVSNPGMLRLARVSAAFDFTTFNEKLYLYEYVTDSLRKANMLKELSPITAVTADDPPVFIVHGDKDQVVPLQQSQDIIARFTDMKVPNQLLIKKGAGHGWSDQNVETELFADWFDKYLK